MKTCRRLPAAEEEESFMAENKKADTNKTNRPARPRKPVYTEEKRRAYIEQRRMSREQCFALLFEMSFTQDNYKDVLDNAIECRLIETDEFTDRMMEYYSANNNAVDDKIRPNIKGWTFERLSRVVLSALRLAVCEVESGLSKPGTAVNEAVELTKKYGAEREHSFVNAVLSAMYREKKQ